MGMFSFIEKGLGLRTGATQAAKQAKKAGEASLLDQQNLKQEIGDIYNPQIQQGSQAFNELNDFYGGNQQGIIDQAQSSPFMSSLVNTGEEAIARNSQMTGGFRSGTTQENLAGNSQDVLMGLVNQILQGKEGIAQAGFGATDAYTTAMQNIVAGTGATRGEIANIGINQAANKGSMVGSILSNPLVGKGIEKGASALMGLFSDKRLKENIVKINNKNGLPWYSWSWNELAKTVGLTGSDEGHIAQEVQEVRPDLVGNKNGFLTVNYKGF
jgi:hypothetical protein